MIRGSRKTLTTFSIIFFITIFIAIPTSARDLVRSNYVYTEKLFSKFLANSERDKAMLNLFVNLMPKGADLHHHFSGAIYAENYLAWAQERGYCIYNTNQHQDGIFKYRVVTKPSELSEKQKEACLLVDAVRSDNQLYRDLLETWSSKDYSNHDHLASPPDKHFFDTFKYFSAISKVEYHAGLQQLKERAIAENVNYIETMLIAAPAVESSILQDIFNGIGSKSKRDEIRQALNKAYDHLVENNQAQAVVANYVRETEAAVDGINDSSFRLRTIAYVNRNTNPSTVFSGLYTAFNSVAKSALIVGVNIVGPENNEVAMRDYELHMQMFDFLKNKHPSVKLSLHAGELTLGMVPPEGLRFHIHDAVLTAGAKRIGHGVDIPYENDPISLMRHMAMQKIAVEINLTSNQEILGVSGSNHPLHVYRRFDVPYVISTDDAGVSRSSLSNEYFLYVTHFKPSYKQLKQTVYRGIEYSFLSELDKKEEIKRLNDKFLKFEALMASSVDLR